MASGAVTTTVYQSLAALPIGLSGALSAATRRDTFRARAEGHGDAARRGDGRRRGVRPGPDDEAPTGEALRRPVTLADVAREARVGESTVSRVLRSHGSFSQKTRSQVEAAVARLGYVPNRIAGTLASTGSRLIGIVIPSLSNIVFPDLLRGATGVLEAEGYQSVIGVTDYDQDREEALVVSLLSWRPAGLLVTGLEHTPGTVRSLRASGVRVVELLDVDEPGLDIVVGYSNRAAGRRRAATSPGAATGASAISATTCRATCGRSSGSTGSAAPSPKPGWRSPARSGCRRRPRSRPAGSAGAAALAARTISTRCTSPTTTWRSAATSTASPGACRSRGRLALFGHNGLDVGRLMPQPLARSARPESRPGRPPPGWCAPAAGARWSISASR